MLSLEHQWLWDDSGHDIEVFAQLLTDAHNPEDTPCTEWDGCKCFQNGWEEAKSALRCL